MNVEVLPNILPFNFIKGDNKFTAESPYQLEKSNIFDSIALIATYANRINTIQSVLDENSIFVNDTNFVDIATDFMNLNITINTGNISDLLSKVTNFIGEWKEIVTIIVIVVIAVLAIGIFIYCYPWLKACLPKRSGKYKVNEVELKESAINSTTEEKKSKEVEEKPIILSYVPQSYVILEKKVPLVEITIFGKKWKVLIDTGSSLSICFDKVALHLGRHSGPIENSVVTARCANGTEIGFSYRFRTKMNIAKSGIYCGNSKTSNSNFPIYLHWARGQKNINYDLILGTDFVRKINDLSFNFVINFRKNFVKMGPCILPIKTFANKNDCSKSLPKVHKHTH